jgi:outer membrane protein assembly factor BamB
LAAPVEEDAAQQQATKAFTVTPLPAEAKDGLDEWDKFARRKQWESAFKALQKVREKTPPTAMFEQKSGFLIPAIRHYHELVRELPPEGKDAYRLFHDPPAKKALAEAKGKDEEARLESIVRDQLLTTSGAEAADRLGDLAFEQGEFGRAISAWESIERFHPDSPLANLRLRMKVTLALLRSGRIGEFKDRARILAASASEPVSFGGETRKAGDILSLWSIEASSAGVAEAVAVAPVAAVPSAAEFPAGTKPIWQFRYLTSSAQKLLASPGDDWGWQPNGGLANHVPPSETDGKRIYVNLLGHLFALDAETGKLVWRTDRFHDLGQKTRNRYGFAPDMYGLTLLGGKLYSIQREASALGNQGAPFRLRCLEPADGKLLWDTAKTDAQGWCLCGKPLFLKDRVICSAFQTGRPTESAVIAVNPADGKLLWHKALGTQPLNPLQNFGTSNPLGMAVVANGRLFVDTHAGALFELDPGSGEIRWGFAYPASVPQQQQWWNGAIETYIGAAPLMMDGLLLVKGMRSNQLTAIDPAGPTVAWKRPISTELRVARADARGIVLVGDEISVLSASDRKLIRSTSIPSMVAGSRTLLDGDRHVAFTGRGFFFVTLADGKSTIFRGSDLDSAGGSVLATPSRLISVSNLMVSAYARPGASKPAAAPDPAKPEPKAAVASPASTAPPNPAPPVTGPAAGDAGAAKAGGSR